MRGLPKLKFEMDMMSFLLLFFLANASHKASPNSKGGETDCTS